MQDYHRLLVWQKVHRVAIDLYQVAGSLSKRDALAVSTQLRRSALSISANIAKASAKGTDAEFRRFLGISMGSAAATQNHLEVLREIGALENVASDDLCARLVEVRKMLSGLMKRLAPRTVQ